MTFDSMMRRDKELQRELGAIDMRYQIAMLRFRDIHLEQESRRIDRRCKKVASAMNKKIMVESKLVLRMIFKVNGVSYERHPKYDLCAAFKFGKIIHVKRQTLMIGKISNSGYLEYMIRGLNDVKQKTCHVHCFVYESFNGIIADGKVIDYKDNNKTNNKLSNLQLLTQKEKF